jgi:hypothetical protein
MDGLATLDADLLVALGSAAGEGLGPGPATSMQPPRTW